MLHDYLAILKLTIETSFYNQTTTNYTTPPPHIVVTAQHILATVVLNYSSLLMWLQNSGVEKINLKEYGKHVSFSLVIIRSWF